MSESAKTHPSAGPALGTPTEPVWSYRGYTLRPSEFTTAMVHFYRAEIQRSNTWRMRLDNTTNWAVIATGAAISFAFSSPENHFGVIILNTLLVTLFLWMEARRYRYYELWSYRARLMETDFFAAMLVPPFAPHPEWAENLAESLLQPQYPITMWEAFGRRFRRNYFWIFIILASALLLFFSASARRRRVRVSSRPSRAITSKMGGLAAVPVRAIRVSWARSTSLTPSSAARPR